MNTANLLRFIPLFALILFCINTLKAQEPQLYSRAEILLGGRTLRELSALGIEADHGLRRGNYSLTTDLSAEEIALVRQAGFEVTVLIPDVAQWYVQQADAVVARSGENCIPAESGGMQYPVPEGYTLGSMGGFFTYAEMLDILDTLHARYPHLITQRAPIDTGLTIEGRPIWYVKVSDNPDVEEGEPQILYTALHHAREPGSMAQMIYYLWHLLEQYPTDPTVRYIVDHSELYFVPCLNPDGYLYNEATNPDGGGLWRKNRRPHPDQFFGVDLNRNYGYFWGNDDSGSSPFPGSNTYRGEGPFSEPETRMLRDFCLARNFRYALNYHTSGNYVIYPWGYNDGLADSVFYHLGATLTRQNRYRVGTALETVGYTVNGTSDDWMYGEAGIYSFTPEVGLFGFWPPVTQILPDNQANLWANRALALFSLAYGEVADGQAPYLTAYSVSWPVVFTRIGEKDTTFTVFLEPGNALVSAVSAPQQVNEQRFIPKELVFDVQLSPDAKSGDTIAVVLAVDNGIFVSRDTVYKILGATERIVDGLPGGTASWSGGWSMTTEGCFSPPDCWTDSPGGVYSNNSFTTLLLDGPVTFPPDALQATLRFMARWDIESEYDYAQLRLIDSTGEEIPLCGRYTAISSPFQFPDQPLWDGVQNEWVEECIDLTPYLGTTFNLAFVLYADGGVAADGFYFDDFRIDCLVDREISAVAQPDAADAGRMWVFPSPASDQITAGWRGVEPEQMEIVDLTGRVVYSQALSTHSTVTVPIANLARGMYQVILRHSRGAITERFLKW